MKQVAVQFSSVEELNDFIHETTAPTLEVNEENITLSCALSEAELEMAMADYHATVITEM